jgi:hypothetical protein
VAINWRVYYGDGSTFSNEDGAPEMAPCSRVIAVAFYDQDNRRRVCHQADYYLWGDGRWYSADASGFWQYMQEPGPKVVKFGREIGDIKYREVMTFALSDLPLSRG